MENKLKTTPNKAVQTFITYGHQKGNRQVKQERLEQLEAVLATQRIYPSEKVYRVLEKVLYDLTYNGIVKVSRKHLNKKLNVGFNSISKAFSYMKKSQLFIVSRNRSDKTNNGCRVLVDVQHENFEPILDEVYGLTPDEIKIAKSMYPYSNKQQNKRQNKRQESAENVDIPTPNGSFSSLNYFNKNKTLKDLKTSTTQASTSKANLYIRLKNLYQARTGSLDDFKPVVGVIYGSMKKIKAEGLTGLSHGQLEAIMYQSLDAMLLTSEQSIKTNRLALLSGIIRNKIQDATTPSLTVSRPHVARKVEQVPEWFATRHEEVVTELTEQEKMDFARERERILAKLSVIE